MRGNGSVRRTAKSERCHARLVEAIARRDAAGARRALRDDIKGAARHIEALDVLPSTPLPH